MTTQTAAELKSVPYNQKQGMVFSFGFGLMVLGAGVLWGPGGMLLSAGVVLMAACVIDEAVERFTGLKRSDQ